VRTPPSHWFDSATKAPQTTLHTGLLKSLSLNTLPVNSLFSRFCETSRRGDPAKSARCNTLRVPSAKSPFIIIPAKYHLFKILRVKSLESRFCRPEYSSYRPNFNAIKILKRCQKNCPHSGFLKADQLGGLKIRYPQPSSGTAASHAFLGARSSRLAAKP
jgi:hypothetical protein